VEIEIPAIAIDQPIGKFYVGSIPACDLKDMAEADIRRIKDRDIERHAGIQRLLKDERVKDIENYIETVDASFPNAIILNVSGSDIEVIEQPGGKCCRLRVNKRHDTFKIIDGQHRLAGFNNDNCEDFDLIVAIFIDLMIEDQAYMFSTINITQAKVSKSLVYDLFDVAETRSPQKTAHSVVKALNSEKHSPFHRRIRLLGVTPKFNEEVLYRGVLTQGTVVDRLLKLISRDPARDRDREKRNEVIELVGNEVEEGLIFREFYARNEDWAILKTMTNFFGSVAEVFRDEWHDLENPLARTIGYGALMRLLVPLYQNGSRNRDVSQAYFLDILGTMYKHYIESGIKITFGEFPAAGNGETKLYRKLLEWAQLK